MWKMFDQYFDSILYSSNESHLKKIIESTIAGVYHFVESGDADESIKIMKINEDFEGLRDNEYLFILGKVYAQLRHVLYMRFQQLASLKTKSKKRFRYVSSDLSLSDDEDEQHSCSLPEKVIE